MNVLSIGSTAFQIWVLKIITKQSWRVSRAYSYDEVEDQVLTRAFQAILVDMDDYTLSPHDLFARISRLTPPFVTIGFLMEEVNTQHQAFFAGAIDVCFRKKTELHILKMQCDSVIRLAHGNKTPIIQVGKVCLDLDTQIVSVSGKSVSLSNREYQLLELLFTNANRIISVERFFDQVYGHQDPPSIKMFDVLICKIRKKLKTAGLSTDVIETRWGQGYSVSRKFQNTKRQLA